MSNLDKIGPEDFDSSEHKEGYLNIGWEKVKIYREEKNMVLTLPLVDAGLRSNESETYFYIVWKKVRKKGDNHISYIQLAEFRKRKDAIAFFELKSK